MTIHKLSSEQQTLVEKWLNNDRRRVAKSEELNHLYDLMMKTDDDARRYEIRRQQKALLKELKIRSGYQDNLADELAESGVSVKEALAVYKRATS
jgi:hypothetical protein